MRKLLATSNDLVLTLLRIALGVVMLPHGMQKMFGCYGGRGPEATLAGFARMGIPEPLGWLVILAESVGAVLLLVGLGTRVAALGVLAIFLVAALSVHLPNGFFMNWGGKQAGEGIEYFLLGIPLAFALVIRGGGALSLDRFLSTR